MRVSPQQTYSGPIFLMHSYISSCTKKYLNILVIIQAYRLYLPLFLQVLVINNSLVRCLSGVWGSVDASKGLTDFGLARVDCFVA